MAQYLKRGIDKMVINLEGKFGFTAMFLLAILASAPVAFSHIGSSDAFVRVVSANPDTRTYTFSCRMDPENDLLRDWFIRPDNGDTADDPNEAAILDKKSNEFMTYTFKQNTFYHVGCYIWNPYGGGNPANDYRGDLHIDLRQDLNSWNPRIVPLSGDGLTATYECKYGSSDYSVSWEVINAQTHERRYIGTGKTISHSVSGHGLYDYICKVKDNTNGKILSTGLPVEYFDQGRPYFPDKSGVPDGIKNVWNRDGAACTPSTETCDSKDNDCDGLIDENNVCGQACSPTAETCNAKDDDCDGLIDEDNICSQSSNCFSNVQNIPASCEGTISSDSMQGGCRVINCNSGSNSMQVKACDKPDSTTPQYFEMYRQTFVNSPLKVCIGNSCIKNEGYVKSQNYPICTGSTQEPTCTPTTETCDSKDNDCDGLVDENNVCAPACSPTTEVCDGKDNDCDGLIDENNVCPTTNCFNKVQNIPATCTGGSIVQDTYNGCRTIICSNGGNFLRVLACDKPDGSIPQFFEMYRQAFAGTIPKICLGSYCIQFNGYVKSGNYPICA